MDQDAGLALALLEATDEKLHDGRGELGMGGFS